MVFSGKTGYGQTMLVACVLPKAIIVSVISAAGQDTHINRDLGINADWGGSRDHKCQHFPEPQYESRIPIWPLGAAQTSLSLL